MTRLDEITSLDDLERRIHAAWNTLRADEPTPVGVDWMVRVVLSGPCPLWSELRTPEDRETLANELCGVLGALDVTVVADGVHPVIPLEEHRLRTDVLGEALRLSEAVRDGRTSLDDLLEGSLAALDSDGPAERQAYVRRLLEGADGEIASRMLEGLE